MSYLLPKICRKISMSNIFGGSMWRERFRHNGTPSVCEVFREFTVLPEIRSFYGIFGSLMHRWKAHDNPRRMTPSGDNRTLSKICANGAKSVARRRTDRAFSRKKFCARAVYVGISTNFPKNYPPVCPSSPRETSQTEGVFVLQKGGVNGVPPRRS